MKVTLAIVFGLLAITTSQTCASEDALPHALPKAEIEFTEATPANFAFDSFLFREKQIRLMGEQGTPQFWGRPFRFSTIDLDADGNPEIILELQDDKEGGPKTYYLCVNRDGALTHVLRMPRHFSIIPRQNSLPDFEVWNKNAEYSDRQRWTYDTRTGIYRRLWAEFYKNDIILETIIDQRN